MCFKSGTPSDLMSHGMSRPPTIQDVRAFWNGSMNGTAGDDAPEHYAALDAQRYALQPEISRYAQFSRWRQKRVLEVGFGTGADLMRFARVGAEIVGIDLALTGAQVAQKRIEHEGSSARVLVANAEHLPFADGSFDLVYSWGAIHHSPDTPGAVSEIHRVLKPGGQMTIMIHHTLSWVVLKILLKYGLMQGELLTHSWSDILSRHSVQAPGNPLTRTYTVAQARKLVNQFQDVHVRVVTTVSDESGLLWAPSFGARVGWALVIRGRKWGWMANGGRPATDGLHHPTATAQSRSR